MKDSQLQSRTPGGASGKRAIGKAVAKGGMLLKGRNPGNVRIPMARHRTMNLTRGTAASKARRGYPCAHVKRVRCLPESSYRDTGDPTRVLQFPISASTSGAKAGHTTEEVSLLGVQALKECVDEVDLGTQYHLSRYAFLCESIVLTDGTTLTPPEDSCASSPRRRPRCLMT